MHLLLATQFAKGKPAMRWNSLWLLVNHSRSLCQGMAGDP